jgi:hypothetical protein
VGYWVIAEWQCSAHHVPHAGYSYPNSGGGLSRRTTATAVSRLEVPIEQGKEEELKLGQ